MASLLRALTLTLLIIGPFTQAADDLAALADAAVARNEYFVEGSGGWRFLPAELRFVAKLASPELNAAVEPAVTAISDFAAQLRADGIKLIVVPVPPRALLRGAELGLTTDQQSAMKAGWEKILSALGGREVTVIDLVPVFSKAKEESYCLRDSHWSGQGIARTTEELLPMLEHAGLEPVHPLGVPGAWTKTNITGDLGGAPEEVSLQFRPSASGATDTKNHPVLLLGDSHLLVFHGGGDLHAKGAGLPDQLAAALGSMPDVIGVRGSGATSSRVALARKTRTDTDYLSGKKVVVWCFAGREFTEADSWKKIPLRRTAP
jgi:hypothetical protein